MVPKVGLEPTRHHWRQILSLVRLPFRHSGRRKQDVRTENAKKGFARVFYTIPRIPKKIKLSSEKSRKKGREGMSGLKKGTSGGFLQR